MSDATLIDTGAFEVAAAEAAAWLAGGVLVDLSPLLLQAASRPAAVRTATTPAMDLDFIVTPWSGRASGAARDGGRAPVPGRACQDCAGGRNHAVVSGGS